MAASSSEEGPVLSLISKRLRTLRKKLKSNPTVAAAIYELQKLRRPLSAAVVDEIRLSNSLKGAVVNGLQIPTDISSDRELKSQKSKKLHSGKKRKPLHIEATDVKAASIDIEVTKTNKANPHLSTIEIASTTHKSSIDGSLSKPIDVTDKKRKLKKSSTADEESDSNIENQNLVNMEPQSNFSEEDSEVASQLEKPKADVDKQQNKGALWAQKSSWTDLVGGTNASFSISQLLPNTKFENTEQVEQPKNWFAAKPAIEKPSVTVVKSSSGVAFSDFGSKSSLGVVKGSAIRAPLEYSIGKTCSFMRSDASMKEWKSAKAALSASLKKKTDRKK